MANDMHDPLLKNCKARNPKKEAGCFDTNDAEKALLRNTRNEQKLARNSRLVLKVVLNSRHDTHVLYPARVGVAIKDLELSLRGAADLPKVEPESFANFSAASRALTVAASIIAGLMLFNFV